MQPGKAYSSSEDQGINNLYQAIRKNKARIDGRSVELQTTNVEVNNRDGVLEGRG